jgi:hypothetical protein
VYRVKKLEKIGQGPTKGCRALIIIINNKNCALYKGDGL